VERLMAENLVQLFVRSDSSRRALNRDEAHEALADDRNWYAPYELGETKRRSVAYRLGYTDSGREEIRREHARTQAIDGRLGQRADLPLYDRSGTGCFAVPRYTPTESAPERNATRADKSGGRVAEREHGQLGQCSGMTPEDVCNRVDAVTLRDFADA
jgi:hypothetical protein